MIPLRDINPTERVAVITYVLIALNVAVFIYEVLLHQPASEVFVNSFGLVPAKLFAPGHLHGERVPVVATVFTSMFLHGGFLHLAGNMLYLWIFGNNIEDATGRFRFLAFYLICGFAAAYAHAYVNRYSLVPMIGASGAISGVLGAYLVLFPRARVLTLVFFGFFIRTVEIPAMVVLVLWFGLQFANALFAGGAQGGGVAWYAHVSGFVSGVLLIGLFKRRGVPFWGGRSSGYL